MTEREKTKANTLEKLHKFMKQYRNIKNKNNKNKKVEWNYSIMSGIRGSYNIPESEVKLFKKLYIDAVVAKNKVHITENHRGQGPIVIDIDLVHESSNRLYTEETIIKIVKSYQAIIKKYLNVKFSQLTAYVSEKRKPVKRNKKYHDGIHIVFPFVCTKPKTQFVMREDFICAAKKNGYFKNMDLENTIENIIDKNVICQTGWSLYGSTKNPESLPYLTTHIYENFENDVYDIILPGEDPLSFENVTHYVDKLSCRRFHSEKSIIDFKNGVDFISMENKIENIKKKLVDENNNNNGDDFLQDIMGNDNQYVHKGEDAEIIEAKELCGILSVERATNYTTWYQVGACLFNIDPSLKETWIEFSKKCPEKFDINVCNKKWKQMRPSLYTIASLHFFAKTDNPEKYHEMRKKLFDEKINNNSFDHTSVAELLLGSNKYEFKCGSIKHKIWFQFKNHKWEEIECAFTLRLLIGSQIQNSLKEKRAEIAKQFEGNGNTKDLIKKITSISDVITKLGDKNFKDGIINEASHLAYEPNFLKSLDENIHILGFTNGVYDLREDTFRDGIPDDNISLCTGYDYIEYDENDKIVKKVMNFFNKIQNTDEMRNYILTLLSTCLSGSISEENFYVLTGSGANGKSKLMELMKYVLGDLFKPMDIKILTTKRGNSSSATPELADKKGIRLCTLDEPEATDEINTGFMKQFTGGDPITARALYKEPIYFVPQFKPFLLCNKKPAMKDDDGGTWRRIKAIEFPNKFIKKTDSNKNDKLNKGEFWADNNLSEQLKEWKQAFMSELIKYHRKYRKHGLNHPITVTKYTDEYQKSCDVYRDFLDDHIERTNNKKEFVTLKTLFSHLRDWYRANYTGTPPNSKQLREYVSNRVDGFQSKKNAIFGYRIKDDSDDEYEGLENID